LQDLDIKWEDTGQEDVDWINVAQDRDRWWDVVRRVMNLQFPQNAWNFLTS
jgi:hypothetical protein